MKVNYRISILVLLIICTLFSSCEKDELNSKELMAYMRDKVVTVHISNELNLLSSDIVVDGDKVANLELGLSRETSVDVKIVAQIDQSLVEKYNDEHGTKYASVDGSMLSLTSMETVIAAGNLKDTLRIGLNREKFIKEATYLVPVRLYALSSDDKGVRISSSSSVTYVVIRASVLFKNIDKTESPLNGIRIDRDAWTTVAGGSNLTSKLYDGNLDTYWSGVTSIRIDMGEVQMLKGFNLVNYTQRANTLSRAPKTVSVFLSEDGVNWEKHGDSNELEKPTEVSVEEVFVEVKLLVPQNVRYFRIDVTASWNSSAYLSEVYALK